MIDFLRAAWLLFHIQLARSAWSRRALACIGLAALAPALAAVVSRLAEVTTPNEISTSLGWFLLLQVVTPLLGLVFGSAVLTEEIEDRTISYLLARPIPRAAILLGRWCAALCLVSILLGLSAVLTTALAAGASSRGPVGPGILLPLVLAALVGGAVYSGLFAAAGVFFRHPMIVGLGYAFAIEGFLANLPGRNRILTVQHHLRSFVAGTGSSAWREVPGFAQTRIEDPTTALLTLGIALACVLALASWRLERREFLLSA